MLFDFFFFFFKQKTAYELRISDWSSDVCSSDLCCPHPPIDRFAGHGVCRSFGLSEKDVGIRSIEVDFTDVDPLVVKVHRVQPGEQLVDRKSTRLNSSH